jgi:hypothetical protein
MTLDERRRVAEADCRANGHDFEHVVEMTGELVQVICGRCGRSWPVGPGSPLPGTAPGDAAANTVTGSPPPTIGP